MRRQSIATCLTIFSDCMNVRGFTEHEVKQKPFLAPFTSFIDWKQSIEERPGNFTQNTKAKMFISWQTFEGICITIYLIVVVVKQLLSRGAKCLFSERFCRDPLEEYFEDQRKVGRRNDKPNIVQFGYSSNTIRI